MFYTTFAHGFQKLRDQDDVLNDVAAAAVSGVVFKSTGGWKAAGRSGLAFAGLAAIGSFAYRMYEEKQPLGSLFSSRSYA